MPNHIMKIIPGLRPGIMNIHDVLIDGDLSFRDVGTLLKDNGFRRTRLVGPYGTRFPRIWTKDTVVGNDSDDIATLYFNLLIMDLPQAFGEYRPTRYQHPGRHAGSPYSNSHVFDEIDEILEDSLKDVAKFNGSGVSNNLYY